MMKRFFFTTSLAALLLTFGLTSMSVAKSALTLNLGQLAFGTYTLQYETSLSPNNSLAIQGEFASLTIGDWTLSNFGGGVGYRIYPGSKAKAPEGLWFGPLVKVDNVSATYQDEGASSMYFTAGGEFGYNWLLGEETAFAIGLALGIYYTAGNISVAGENLSYGGILPGLGINIGIGF